MKKMIYIIIGIVVVAILIIGVLVYKNQTISTSSAKIGMPIDRKIAMEYFDAYAKFEKVNLEEYPPINNEEKIRGKVGAAEFEYRDKEKLFIVRGLVTKNISKANPLFKKLLIEKLMEMNKTIGGKFGGAYFEFDDNASELGAKYPERINVRLDLKNTLETKTFVKIVDKLMDETYRFYLNEYPDLNTEISKIVFPE